jgi:hypothetical protein
MVRRAAVLLLVALLAGCGAPDLLPSIPTPQPTTPIPPVATLTVPGGQPIEGQVGTYAWDGFASDAPWLRGGDPVHVPADILASVRFPPGTDISTWIVEYAPLPPDGPADPARSKIQQRSETAEVDFPAPPAGTWSVRLWAEFPGHGSVGYFWRFEVSA